MAWQRRSEVSYGGVRTYPLWLGTKRLKFDPPGRPYNLALQLSLYEELQDQTSLVSKEPTGLFLQLQMHV